MDGMDGKVIRRTWPTASFSLTTELIEWIAQESEEKAYRGSKSKFVRAVLQAAKDAQEREAA
jgi:Arc/MetJ-type ribon-helix-helix transcriptional regulator